MLNICYGITIYRTKVILRSAIFTYFMTLTDFKKIIKSSAFELYNLYSLINNNVHRLLHMNIHQISKTERLNNNPYLLVMCRRH